MRYLLMCCADENRWDDLPDSQRKRIMDEYRAFIEGIKRSGHYVDGAMLDRSSHAITVREINGKPAVTDGPFTETKEQLGGYHVVECKDQDEAISLAMRIPTLGVGCSVEVRAIFSASEG